MCKHSGKGRWIHNQGVRKIRSVLNIFKLALENMHIWKGNETQRRETGRWQIMSDWNETDISEKKTEGL